MAAKGRTGKSSHTPADAVAMPIHWRDAIGHESAWARIRVMIDSQRMYPVIIFDGIAGLAKRSFVLRVVASAYCESQSACGSCSACREVLMRTHSDLFWLEAKDNDTLGVEDIEALQAHLQLLPDEGAEFRTAVIVDADRMTLNAAQKLLKILEEPPANGRIFLTTARYRQLLPTIRSRCLRFRMPLPQLKEGVTWLIARASAELGIALEFEKARAILIHCGGSLGRAWAHTLAQKEHVTQAESLLYELFKNPNEAERSLALNMRLTRELKLSAEDISDQSEIVLNRVYRELLVDHRSGRQSSAHEIAHRRRILSQFRRTSVHKKVALNQQLTLDAAVLTQGVSS